MPSTYSVAEAQAQLPALLRKVENELIVITRRDKTVAYLVSAQGDPEAMKAVRQARAGKGKYYPANIVDEPDQG